jgi:hypothetical protein
MSIVRESDLIGIGKKFQIETDAETIWLLLSMTMADGNFIAMMTRNMSHVAS